MITHLFAGLPVKDLDAALDWYERFCARPPDTRPNADEAVWQLVPSGLIYVVRDLGISLKVTAMGEIGCKAARGRQSKEESDGGYIGCEETSDGCFSTGGTGGSEPSVGG
jgi:hypothetical protein